MTPIASTTPVVTAISGKLLIKGVPMLSILDKPSPVGVEEAKSTTPGTVTPMISGA
jgi:hypothetical protein